MAEVEPFPFASVEELKARWPDMPAGAEEHAEVLLEDASQFILDVCPSAADVSAGTRRRIVCSVVRRSIEAQSSPGAGMSQFQATTGPFTNSFTDRKSTRLNSSHVSISYAVFCLKKKIQ